MHILEARLHPQAPQHLITSPASVLGAEPLERGDDVLETVPVAAGARLLPDWRGLADRALEFNPFMAPEFILPAAMHLAGGKDPVLSCVWRNHARSRELIGLFLAVVPRSRGFGWREASRGGLWNHELMPLGVPLLSADPDAASAALAAFTRQRRRGHGRTLVFPAVDASGPVMTLLLEMANRLGLTVERAADSPHSRGLDIDLARGPDTAGVVIAREPQPLRAMLEQALAMDATVKRAPGDRPADIDDAGRLAFMRAVIRGLGQTGQVVMARVNDGARKAVAIAIDGPDRAYLWRLFGPSAHEPMTEAALTWAIRDAVGKPVAAATAYPIAGFCTVALRTQTVVLS